MLPFSGCEYIQSEQSMCMDDSIETVVVSSIADAADHVTPRSLAKACYIKKMVTCNGRACSTAAIR